MLQKGNLRPIIMYSWNKGHDQDHKIIRPYACNVILLIFVNNNYFEQYYHGQRFSVLFSHCLKLVRTPLNVYFTAFKSSFLSLSLCTYKLGWMSCLISFERCQSSCEERGTSEHYKKFLSTVGFEPPTPAPLVFQRVHLTPRQLTTWY